MVVLVLVQKISRHTTGIVGIRVRVIVIRQYVLAIVRAVVSHISQILSHVKGGDDDMIEMVMVMESDEMVMESDEMVNEISIRTKKP